MRFGKSRAPMPTYPHRFTVRAQIHPPGATRRFIFLRELGRVLKVFKHPVCDDDINGASGDRERVPRAYYMSFVKVWMIPDPLVDVCSDHFGDLALELLKPLGVSRIRKVKLPTATSPIVQQRHGRRKQCIDSRVDPTVPSSCGKPRLVVPAS